MRAVRASATGRFRRWSYKHHSVYMVLDEGSAGMWYARHRQRAVNGTMVLPSHAHS